jgi:hypothetical protein
MAMPSARRLWFAIASALVAGCSSDPPSAEVSGTITYGGKPLETGHISFFPRDKAGQTSVGEIVNGAYTAKGVSLGEMDVKINASKVTGSKKLLPHDPKSPVIETRGEMLPDRYHEKTTLILDVKERVVKKDWNLKK